MFLAHVLTLTVHYLMLFISLVRWVSFHHKFMAGETGTLKLNGVPEVTHVVGLELGIQIWMTRIQSSNSPSSPTATG